MQDKDRSTLSGVRLKHAKECLASAKSLFTEGDCKGSANRSYYAIFHAMRAVLALDGIDMKRHSGIISEFRRLYIKTGIFPEAMSVIISEAFDVRTDCDYDDFFVITEQEAAEQIERAGAFTDAVSVYLSETLFPE